MFFCNYMNRPLTFLVFILLFSPVSGQQERLPGDLRQHNLTTYNASLFNPTFSLGRNNPESVAFWARWQWQDIDSDPSTLFLNYTRTLNERSAAGAAFFQHNTGIFFNTGATLNYAYKFELNPRVKLAIGANLFGFRQKLADDRFPVNPNLPLPLANETDDFILQMAPGISLEIERLTLSLASENLLDYNFTAKEGNTAKEDKIFMSLLSYDFPIGLGSASNAFLRPSMYLRTIPGQSNQVGFYTLLNTDKYYGQLGYNNFYGYAIGGGITFFKRVSVGALVELGTSASIRKETSFELMVSYFLGTPDERHQMVGYDIDEEEINVLDQIEEQRAEAISAQEELDKEKESAEKLKIEEAERANAIALKEEQKRGIDSVAQAKVIAKQVAQQLEEQDNAKKEAPVKPQASEKYEEVRNEDGLEPGFYLIANVFGTKKYFDAFMVDLRKNGIQPKSFLRSKNGFNYVYLQRYSTIREARMVRNSNYDGKYTGATWIFRVVGD